MRGPGLGEEALRLVTAAPIDIHRNHLEVLAAEHRFELVERGHLLPAGHAPRGPDVEQYDLAAPVAQGLGPAVGAREADLAEIERLWPGEERRHGALVQAGERAMTRNLAARRRSSAFILLYR